MSCDRLQELALDTKVAEIGEEITASLRWETPRRLAHARQSAGRQQKRMLGVVRLFVLSRCNNSVSKEYLEPTRPVAVVESGGRPMPWTANGAEKHTHKATTTELKELLDKDRQ